MTNSWGLTDRLGWPLKTFNSFWPMVSLPAGSGAIAAAGGHSRLGHCRGRALRGFGRRIGLLWGFRGLLCPNPGRAEESNWESAGDGGCTIMARRVVQDKTELTMAQVVRESAWSGSLTAASLVGLESHAFRKRRSRSSGWLPCPAALDHLEGVRLTCF